MSLHANLSEEARQRMQMQKRNSTISAILIAMLTICLIGMILGAFMLVQTKKIEDDGITVIPTEKPAPPQTPEVKHRPRVPNHPTPPKDISRSDVIKSINTTPVSLPNLADTDDVNINIGVSDDLLSQIGDISPIDPRVFKPIIPDGPMRDRCSQENRTRRLKEAGGNIKCENAVIKALDFLKETQNADGSWDDQHQPAMTGLVLLAYLGHCETPKSPKYGDTVGRAIGYLVNLGLKNDGKLTSDTNDKHWSYEHAVATYALGEAHALCTQAKSPVPNLEKVVKQAGQIIVDKQGPNGGWGYAYKGDGDLSIIGWQLQALKAVDNSGVKLKKLRECIDKAMTRLEKHQTPDGGFNYGTNGSGPKNGTTGYRNLSGVGVLCMQVWGHGKSKAALKGVEYISKNSKFEFDQKHSDIYGHYYDAQAMINHGGKGWNQYNQMIRDELLENQERDGSWKMPKLTPNVKTPTYRTALITLTLEVYYRFLPSADGSH